MSTPLAPDFFSKYLAASTADFLIEQRKMEAFVNDAIEQVDSGNVQFEFVQWIDSATGEVQHERPVDNMQRSEVVLSVLEAQLLASFGPKSETPFDKNGWMAFAAFLVTRKIDWRYIADRMLRHYAVDYVPSEANIDQFPDS